MLKCSQSNVNDIVAYVEVGESTIFRIIHVSLLNGNPTLSKVRLNRIKTSNLYMKPKLLTIATRDTMLHLGCNFGLFQLRFGLLRGFIGCEGCIEKIGNRWVEYRYPIKLTDLSNMEIVLCLYQKGINNKWSYNLIDYLVVDL